MVKIRRDDQLNLFLGFGQFAHYRVPEKSISAGDQNPFHR
jgi:hypothetical protein